MELFNPTYRSAEIDKISGAMAKAQGTYAALIPNEDAAGGKYANLKAILAATRESLSSNGISFFQGIELLDEGSGAALLVTEINHESGQYKRSIARVVSGATDRQTGNVYEMHKRLHALMILGIAPSENDPLAFDDNGIEQTDTHTINQLKKPAHVKKDIDRTTTISSDQYNDLMIELDGYEDIVMNIQEVYNISTLADLPKSEYHPALIRVRRIKKTQEEYDRTRKR